MMTSESFKFSYFFAIAFVVLQVFSNINAAATTTEEQFAADAAKQFTPTDPLDINKIAFQPLQSNFGNVGPILYDILTEKNALGEPISKLSNITASKLDVNNLKLDMEKIFKYILDSSIQERAIEIYNKIKDVQIEGTTNESLQDVVEILKNIFNNQDTVEEIRRIIKEI